MPAPKSPNRIEHRADRRAPGVLAGRWSGSNAPCRISTLSVSGCYIESIAGPPKGEHLRIQIELPDDDPLTVDAEVVYGERGMGFAVRFIDMSDAVSKRLAQVVDLLFSKSMRTLDPF
jgi:PilZ domain